MGSIDRSFVRSVRSVPLFTALISSKLKRNNDYCCRYIRWHEFVILYIDWLSLCLIYKYDCSANEEIEVILINDTFYMSLIFFFRSTRFSMKGYEGSFSC